MDLNVSTNRWKVSSFNGKGLSKSDWQEDQNQKYYEMKTSDALCTKKEL